MSKAVLIQRGNNIDYVAASDIGYLDIVPLVSRIGVVLEDIKAGETGSVAVTEVWEMPAESGTAFAVGDLLYWNTIANNLTKTSGSNIPAGWATEPKGMSETTARVKIG